MQNDKENKEIIKLINQIKQSYKAIYKYIYIKYNDFQSKVNQHHLDTS